MGPKNVDATAKINRKWIYKQNNVCLHVYMCASMTRFSLSRVGIGVNFLEEVVGRPARDVGFALARCRFELEAGSRV